MTGQEGARGMPRISNEDVAEVFDEVGQLLEIQGGNPFRVRAYREGASTIRAWPVPVRSILSNDGVRGLESLPGIGRALARATEEIVESGRLRLLDRLRGVSTPEDLFRMVPGIGPELAHRIHSELDIETLEELEIAAHDGRLEATRGFGPRRARGVRASLASMLGGSARRRAIAARGSDGGPAGGARRETPHRPPVGLLLSVDAEYRERAAADELPRIAPRRFNPTGRAWLPILHSDRPPWHFTALFSNTARAHQLGRTDDWVVVYGDDEDGEEQRFTVVTEYRGDLSGKRVVRGREAECRAYYARD